MQSQPKNTAEFNLDEIEAAVGPTVARHVESLVESLELTEEQTVVHFWGFELRRWRRTQRSRRRRWIRWVSIASVFVIAIAGILELWLFN
ncbi:MAG: hypothetical protein ETSY1_47150 (plasmid) [Candidatus Entotheonella factor]|uniref:Uncharacterized protein n=1 Tax=Entotheonella factor TaxID=1429438 RepID=W4M0F1_ENTF1|nr:MAG: hypothetical protein ETSY1_47150 [Candidatus Entotheonella factor]